MSNWNPEPGGTEPGGTEPGRTEPGWSAGSPGWSAGSPGWSAPDAPGWAPPAAAGLPPQPGPAQPAWGQPAAPGWNAPAAGWSPPQQGPGGYMQPYQAGGYPQPMAQAGGNGMATASLVLGITSIVFCWWGLGTLAQIVLAGVFGVLAINKANSGLAGGRSLAIAGLICGGVGFLAYFIIGVATLGIGFIV
jgi:hypothetical protein